MDYRRIPTTRGTNSWRFFLARRRCDQTKTFWNRRFHYNRRSVQKEKQNFGGLCACLQGNRRWGKYDYQLIVWNRNAKRFHGQFREWSAVGRWCGRRRDGLPCPSAPLQFRPLTSDHACGERGKTFVQDNSAGFRRPLNLKRCTFGGRAESSRQTVKLCFQSL